MGPGEEQHRRRPENAEGVEVAHELARRADVAVENFRPGVADKLGIGYSALSQLNSRLIYCSISGFGQRGKYRSIKGYDAVVAAKTGRMLGRRPWRRAGPLFEAIPRMSYGTAHLAAQSILAALLARERTGSSGDERPCPYRFACLDCGRLLTGHVSQKEES